MLDLGWTEILVIGVVALVVIGPRDLPLALHTLGKYVGKLKSMAREFQSGIDDIARQHELKELQEGINKFSSPEKAIEDYVSKLEKTGAKPAPVESENSILGDGGTEPAKDWNAASAEIASPAAKSVAADAEPELSLDAPDKDVGELDLPISTGSPDAAMAEQAGVAGTDADGSKSNQDKSAAS